MIDSPSSPNFSFTPADIEKSVDYYNDAYGKRITGPQLEGLDGSWVRSALEDPATETLRMTNQHGETVVWPLLVGIGHDEEYRKEFFDEHYSGKNVKYLSLPPLDELGDGVDMDDLREIALRLNIDDIIVYDYQVGTEYGDASLALIRTLARFGSHDTADVTPDSEAFGQYYDKPTVNHFEIIAQPSSPESFNAAPKDLTVAARELIASGEVNSFPHNGAVLLSQEDFTRNDGQMLDQIWDMYSAQFSTLVEDHPSLQIQPREELEKMIQDKDTLAIAYMEDNVPVGLCYFVTNIDTCIWLNSEYFKARDDSDETLQTVYFPGIVVEASKARQGSGYVAEMLDIVAKVTNHANTGMRITFQSTNVSETYIPKIIVEFIDSIDEFTVARPHADDDGFMKTAQYNYKLIAITDAEL